jgi:hypothetical protein
MAHYYSEAELCLERNCCLSYTLMCGAIFESILYDKFHEDAEVDKNPSAKNFGKLLDKAHIDGEIFEDTYNVMNNAKNKRNLIHAGCDSEEYPTRRDAMDIRAALTRELISYCYHRQSRWYEDAPSKGAYNPPGSYYLGGFMPTSCNVNCS